MPLEIRELIIKVTVEDSDKKSPNDKNLLELKKSIVKECTEKILLQLKAESER
jgi:hypothetical protein